MSKYDDLVNAAKDANAKDPRWVAEIARHAVCVKGDSIPDTVAQIKRSQPNAFYSRPAKPKGNHR